MTMYVVKVGINGEPVVEVTRLAAYTPTGYDAVARFVRG